jgi:hypothetical protein
MVKMNRSECTLKNMCGQEFEFHMPFIRGFHGGMPFVEDERETKKLVLLKGEEENA